MFGGHRLEGKMRSWLCIVGIRASMKSGYKCHLELRRIFCSPFSTWMVAAATDVEKVTREDGRDAS